MPEEDPEIVSVPDAEHADEELPASPARGWRVPRWVLLLAAALLVAGVVARVELAGGDQHPAADRTGAPLPSPTLPDPTLAASGMPQDGSPAIPSFTFAPTSTPPPPGEVRLTYPPDAPDAPSVVVTINLRYRPLLGTPISGGRRFRVHLSRTLPPDVHAALEASFPGARVRSSGTLITTRRGHKSLASRTVVVVSGRLTLIVEAAPWSSGDPSGSRSSADGAFVSRLHRIGGYAVQVTVQAATGRAPARAAERLADDARLLAL